MIVRAGIKLVFAFAMVCSNAVAADFSDPTWPCIQRKVERLSAGLMWPAAIEPIELDPEKASAAAELAGRLALRRIELEDFHDPVGEFISNYDADMTVAGHVFQQVFDALSNRRDRIIDGIEEFSLSQIALAEKIEMARVEMNGLLEVADPDFDRVDALEEQIDWDQVIYTDRQKSITYLCETPVLLEKRLYAIAQLLAAAAKPAP